MKKIISLVLALAFIVTVFSACGNSAGAAVPADINDEGVFVYSITRSADASSAVESSAKNMRTELKKGLDCNILLLKDSVEDYDGNYEILIGSTNRPESAEAIKILTDNRQNNNHDFIVKVSGSKIAVTGTTDNMTDLACEWFIKTFGTSENWAMLYDGYQFMFTPDVSSSTVNTAAGNDIGFYTLVVPKQWTYLCGREVSGLAAAMAVEGYSMETAVDGKDSEKELEIIFGDTERPESKAVTVGENDYVIKVVGKKIVIKGGSDLSTWQAIADFNAMLADAFASKKPLVLEDGTVINGKYDAAKDGAYTLNFGDDFNGSTIDCKKWANYGNEHSETNPTGASCLGGKCYSAYYKNTDFVWVKDGNVCVKAAKINDTDFRGVRLSTCYSMVFRYGFWETRVKMPESPATVTLWTNAAYLPSIKPALGDLSREGFTEVDVAETFGSTNTFAANVHRWFGAMNAAGNYEDVCTTHTSLDGDPAYNGTENNRRFRLDEGNIYDDYHIYSYYWDNECMEFAFDGKVFCKYNYADQTVGTSIHCMQNFIVMGIGMGSASYGQKWQEGMPEAPVAYYDYTRIYQTNAVNSQMRLGDGFSLEGNYTGNVKYVYPEQPMSE